MTELQNLRRDNGKAPGGVTEPSPTHRPSESTVIFGSVSQEILNRGKQQYTENNEKDHQTNESSHEPGGNDMPDQRQKVFSSTCRPVAKEKLRIELPRETPWHQRPIAFPAYQKQLGTSTSIHQAYIEEELRMPAPMPTSACTITGKVERHCSAQEKAHTFK